MPKSDCSITPDLTAEELAALRRRLDDHDRASTGGRIHQPDVDINVIAVSAAGEVVGGLNASTKLGVMFLEVLWMDDALRGRGLGAAVVLEGERIAREAGCGAAQTWTFSFQAPGFYEKLGYRRIGLFEGYPNGITEHVLMKRLPGDATLQDIPGFEVRSTSREGLAPVLSGFHDFCVAAVGDEMENPGITIELALRDGGDNLVGGLYAWTTLQIVAPECVWVDADVRGRGYGNRMMEEAERIAREHGCISSQTGAFSFQSPGFFRSLGYSLYGSSDAYPEPYTEEYFVKRLTT